ncbi:ATPase [Bacillus phage G]|uniref:Gp566 n=1 Tax=Bacillus phage G TaxID=2884420 RepID=G3MAU6_9CAUD|nr:ATPase [Bacillus phage G]AEO93812.1 gp566 [Bacillus phage G]
MSSSTISKVTPNEFINIVEPLYSSGEQIPTIMLWGPPGVGKSEAIQTTLAKRIAKNTGKTVKFTDVRLLLFNPVDLRGIPVPDQAHEFTKWLKPQIFNMDPDPNVVNILLLDEISAAPPAVQAAAFQLTLDRKIGEHTLPDNVIIIAAGNRVVDKGVAYKMPTPLANRMTHFEIHADLEDWKEWAIPNGIHPTVIGFLNFQGSYLHKFDPSKDDLAFPTPRAWSFVSKYLKLYGNDIDRAYPMIAGTIGTGPAHEFKAFANTYGKLPDINRIMDGEKIDVPKSPDILYALSAALTYRIPKATDEQIKNIVLFTMGLSKEFAVLTMRDILRVEGAQKKIMTLKEWTQWAKAHKELIVG